MPLVVNYPRSATMPGNLNPKQPRNTGRLTSPSHPPNPPHPSHSKALSVCVSLRVGVHFYQAFGCRRRIPR